MPSRVGGSSISAAETSAAQASAVYSKDRVQKAISKLSPLVLRTEGRLEGAESKRCNAFKSINDNPVLQARDRFLGSGYAPLASVFPLPLVVAASSLLLERGGWKRYHSTRQVVSVSASDLERFAHAFATGSEYDKAFLGQLASEWSNRFPDALSPDAKDMLFGIAAREVHLPMALRVLTRTVRSEAGAQ